MAAETPSAARCRRGRRRSRDDSSGGSRRVRALDSRSGSCFAHGLGASHAVLCSRFGLGGSYTRGGASHAALCCRFCSCFAHGFGELYARAACWLVVLLALGAGVVLAAARRAVGMAGNRLARGCIIGAPTTQRGAPRNGSQIAERREHGRRTRPTAHRSASFMERRRPICLRYPRASYPAARQMRSTYRARMRRRSWREGVNSATCHGERSSRIRPACCSARDRVWLHGPYEYTF
jgi:hypothetical protein